MKLKKIIYWALFAAALALHGCGKNASDMKEIQMETIPEEENLEDQTDLFEIKESEKDSLHGTPDEEPVVESSLSFDDLSKLVFEYSSGGGGWFEELKIEKDGYFTGNYHDSDMGDAGEGYSDGTVYASSFSGHFTNLEKVDETTYLMACKDISYQNTPGDTEIVDNIKYIYTQACYLVPGKSYNIYLPGKPMSDIPEDVRVWLYPYNDQDTLSHISIVEIGQGIGVNSFERMQPYEDAKSTYDSYQSNLDYLNEQMLSSQKQADITRVSAQCYQQADDCLNYIWNLIRYNLPEDRFQEVLDEQRSWVSEKEVLGKTAASKHTAESAEYYTTLTDFTMKRCEVLVSYLK